MTLEDGGVHLEVVVPTITRGGHAVDDNVGTSSPILRSGVKKKKKKKKRLWV